MRAVIAAGALALLLAAAPSAGMVAVYAPASGNAGADLEALRVAAAYDAPLPPGFTRRVSDSCVVSADFSVPPGATAYFLARGSLEMRPDFEMLGESVLFESVSMEAPSAEPVIVSKEGARAFGTALRAASWSRGAGSGGPSRLRLSYALDAPARVTAEVLTASGRVLAARAWSEASAGAFERDVTLDRVAEPVFVRWRAGDVTAIRKVQAR